MYEQLDNTSEAYWELKRQLDALDVAFTGINNHKSLTLDMSHGAVKQALSYLAGIKDAINSAGLYYREWERQREDH